MNFFQGHSTLDANAQHKSNSQNQNGKNNNNNRKLLFKFRVDVLHLLAFIN